MRVSNTPDYGAGVNGWRKLLIEQANDLVVDKEAELYPWLVEQGWEVKRAGLLAGPLPVLLGTGDPEGKFQDPAQGGGGSDTVLEPEQVLGAEDVVDDESEASEPDTAWDWEPLNLYTQNWTELTPPPWAGF